MIPVFYREALLTERGIDVEGRSATFVASTENPVDTWDGPEVLRMSGASLGRYRANPVVLDAHDRSSLDAVIGRAEITIEDRRLIAKVTYAGSDRAERAWKLVRDGFVRAMSVGYRVDPTRVKRLADGQTDGEGDAMVTGPAVIAKRWELLELSNVPVPADAAAVATKRAFYEAAEEEIVDPNGKNSKNAAPTPAPSGPAPPKPAEPAPAPAATPAASAARGAESDPIIRMPENPEEVRRRSILAITPRGLESVAEDLILDGKSLEEARAALKEERAKRLVPVGTPEPPAPASAPKSEGSRLAAISDEDLSAALRNL